MKILNKVGLVSIQKELERLQSASVNYLSVDDTEMHTEIDIYDEMRKIIETIERIIK